jgi:hypothetical protein
MAVELNRMSAATRIRASADVLDRGSMAFACFAFIYLYSNLASALPIVWQFPLWPSHFYVLILLFTGTILAISPAAIEAFLQHRNFIFTLLAFVPLEGARAIFTPLVEGATQILIYNCEYVLVTISFVVIFSLCKRLDRIIQVVGLVLAVSAGINLIQYYLPQLLPVAFRPEVSGRAAGFAFNANDSATFICLPLPLVAFFAPRLMRCMWYTIALAGIVVTFSRAGMILWVAAVAVTEFLKQRERTGLRFPGMILLTIQFLFVALVLAYAVSVFGGLEALFPDLDSNTSARVNFTADDNGRLYAAERCFDMFLDAPLFGNGIGSTLDTPVGSHNMLVLILADLGLVGGIWIAAFLLSIARYGAPFGLLVVIMFSVSAPFTHNHFEWPQVGMLFALYLIVAKRLRRNKGPFNGAEPPGSRRTFGRCARRP